MRAFQVVLDTGEKPNTLNIETENLHCSLNIDRLAIDEVNKLTQFIEDAKRKIENTDKNQINVINNWRVKIKHTGACHCGRVKYKT